MLFELREGVVAWKLERWPCSGERAPGSANTSRSGLLLRSNFVRLRSSPSAGTLSHASDARCHCPPPPPHTPCDVLTERRILIGAGNKMLSTGGGLKNRGGGGGGKGESTACVTSVRACGRASVQGLRGTCRDRWPCDRWPCDVLYVVPMRMVTGACNPMFCPIRVFRTCRKMCRRSCSAAASSTLIRSTMWSAST